MLHVKVLCSVGRSDSMVVDVGAAADWVKINVRKTVSLNKFQKLAKRL